MSAERGLLTVVGNVLILLWNNLGEYSNSNIQIVSIWTKFEIKKILPLVHIETGWVTHNCLGSLLNELLTATVF